MEIPGIYVDTQGGLREFTYSGLILVIDVDPHVVLEGDRLRAFGFDFTRAEAGTGLLGTWTAEEGKIEWTFLPGGLMHQKESGERMDSGFWRQDGDEVKLMAWRSNWKAVGNTFVYFGAPNGGPGSSGPYWFEGDSLIIDAPGDPRPQVYRRIS